MSRCMKMTVLSAVTLAAVMSIAGAAGAEDGMRTITDGAGREVEVPQHVESIVCSGVGALRYTCYMQAQDLVVGVEDYEQGAELTRGYSIVNGEAFAQLPVIGGNGEPYVEEIIMAEPDVIVMSAYSNADADTLQDTTGIPVVVIPGSDSMLDEKAYETLRIMGELYEKEDRAQELTDYMDEIREDLEERTADIQEEEKKSVYVGGVSFKGVHGFEGTEAGYGPFSAIHAKNLADETDQNGAFNIELEKVLAWDPDVIFIDFNGLDLIKEDYASNPDYYNQLKAVQEGEVYSQISFRSYASNLDMALADTYYAASILYPEQFADVSVEEKAGEIFTTFLGEDITGTLKENGYEFRKITLSEE
ncbi:MAG: iron ABC transporter substrate-binding protein [Lachnospiraceae bacterium]|uniref:iron ABC transporter substrate-binding protein n=1 Tax=Parablautia sp. Marseille-Q6255 TaxID=3039593 RepID=UPI0024BCB523|nr:iron ABC transporter substrate-binding protein [Parablautia sp. Marseille-Q6255]